MRARLALAFALAGCGFLALLGACSREPDFDARYAEASRKVEERAHALDREMASEAATPPPGEGPAKR